MPAYSSAPPNRVPLMTPGVPAYCFGSFSDRVGNTKMLVTNVALTSNVATLTVAVISGNIPAAGSLITTSGIPAAGGEFNVTQVALSTVSIDAGSGIGIVTFPLTAANVGSQGSSGQAIVQVPEVPESLATLGAVSSIAWAVPMQPSQLSQGRSITAVVSFPTGPTAATVSLQQAVVNQDSEFETLATVASYASSTLTGGQVTQADALALFFRLNISGLTAGSGTVVGKLLI